MIRPARLSSHACKQAVGVAAAGAERLASTVGGRKKAAVFAGAALALAGAGSASAATVAGSATPAATATARPATARPASARPAAPRIATTSASPAAVRGGKTTAAPQAASQPQAPTWVDVRNAINAATDPASARVGVLPPSGMLTPAGTAGPQAWMQLSPAQMANATTIVQQTLDRHMGIRAAVIAIATAMQESQLLNLHYGDLDSLGLFQQRPSMGWGTAAQITTPAYAANAFLTALQQHQAGDPGWAQQPLWANAQAVQKSGFPFAYAKWELQAAGLVKQIAMSLHHG